jgi:hypothetical protein
MTLNQLIANIQNLGEKHRIIQRTFRGNIVDFLSSENLYPGFLFDVVSATIQNGQMTVAMEFFFMDRNAQDESNEMEVLSDQLQIAQDIIAQMRDQNEEYELNDNINVTFFVDRTGDVLAGVRCDISVNLPYISDRCAVPTELIY